MEGRYGLYSQGRSGWTSMRNEEFQEEDVWDVDVKERTDFTNSKVGSSESSSTITPRQLSSAAKMIPRNNNHNNYNTTQEQEPKIVHQSAPVNIPDWSNMYGKNKNSKKASKNVSSWLDDDNDEEHDDDDDDDDDGGDSDDDDGDMMPPHEWIARKTARSKTSSFSVCEGAGRTLKGRDLSRVRNTVLTRTGFLE